MAALNLSPVRRSAGHHCRWFLATAACLGGGAWGAQNGTAAECAAGLTAAQAEIRRGDDAAARTRWVEAVRAYQEADTRLRDLEDRCSAEVAEKASAAIDDLLAKKAAAEAADPQADCSAAREIAEERERVARTGGDGAGERLWGQAESAWGQAAAACSGADGERARERQAAAGQSRVRAAAQGSGAVACDQSLAEAERLVASAGGAWHGKAWPEAARRLREAESAWGRAAEKCGGAERERALRQQRSAATDAMNAEQCMPAWERAEALEGDYRSLPATTSASGREILREKAESAWRGAADGCQGDSRERALAKAGVLARAGEASPPATAAPRPEVAPAPPLERAMAAPPRATPSPPPAPEPAQAGGQKSFKETVAAAAAAAAGFIDRTVAGAASALGLPAADGDAKDGAPGGGEVLRVGTTTYTGSFQRDGSGGTVSGQGRVEWSNGDVFTGTLVRGKAEGRGAMAWRKTGSRYEGDWKNDQQTGRGTMIFGDGTRYSGDFIDGHLTGRGRYDYAATGESYDGEVHDGKPQGRGTYTWKSGDRYDGQWLAGKKHGQGRYTWTDGSYWEGEYLNDERTENGRTVFPIESR